MFSLQGLGRRGQHLQGGLGGSRYAVLTGGSRGGSRYAVLTGGLGGSRYAVLTGGLGGQQVCSTYRGV